MTEVEKAEFLLEVFRDWSHLCDENLLLLRNDFLWKWRTKGKGKGFFKKELEILLCRTRRALNFFPISKRFWLQLGLHASLRHVTSSTVCVLLLKGSVEIGGGEGKVRASEQTLEKCQSSVSAHSKSTTVLLTDDVSVAEFM